ncbi:hypothetical protein G4B88_023653 [Cannabis sativa]|uniref:TF-B3 domain-containing protein n=1 Tax=Cannabis sativa TaxID=3483 RepID=A0A7J6HW91_CANSA|nr:hypothetical protein G4B88_023653 [Cannabis sativa]
MAPIQKKSTLRPLFTLVVDEKAIVQHKLRIPKKCVMLFGEELGEMGTLTVPHGNGNRAWKVRIVKNGKNKKKKCHNNNNIWFKDEQVDDDDNDNDEHEMVVPRSFDYHKGRRLVMSKGAKAAQAAAYASKSKLHNPSFMGLVNQHNIRMVVPAEFVRRHMKFCVDKSVEVELQPQTNNDEKMKWVVSCCPMKKCGTLMKRLGKGWSSFSSNQNLKSGDVCVFEMIPNLNDNDF